MKREMSYSNLVGQAHIKQYGQYFTDKKIANFMVNWVCRHAKTMLDPAVGNSIFFNSAKEQYFDGSMEGYEIDNTIIDYFGNPTKANIIMDDYLASGWEKRYDAIVCNPPYNRFQAIENRREILKAILNHSGIKFSGYTNQYILFLIKSIFQMSDVGRLAYIIPTEFLNSKYGTAIKDLLIKEKLLNAIINFENDQDIFFNATTTCCILLLDHTEKQDAKFYNIKSIDDLDEINLDNPDDECNIVPYSQLISADKWRLFFDECKKKSLKNLRNVKDFCYASRGIATGANDYFCLSKSVAMKNNIPRHCLMDCVCRSADIKSPIFTERERNLLEESDKNIFLLDIEGKNSAAVSEYISYGIVQGVNQKYLPAHRSPWYSMEHKDIAPIWISSACRGTIKVVRNLANVNALTTFHMLYVNEEYKNYTDVIFCYLLTPTAQQILRENRKQLGNGLDKFQPSDINQAQMLDISVISQKHIDEIMQIYNQMMISFSEKLVDRVDEIVSLYL